MPNSDDDDGFLIEYFRIGNSVKVSAIDPVTGIEASTVGPAHASDAQLAKAAAAKLRYVLARRKPEPR